MMQKKGRKPGTLRAEQDIGLSTRQRRWTSNLHDKFGPNRRRNRPNNVMKSRVGAEPPCVDKVFHQRCNGGKKNDDRHGIEG